MAMCVGTISGSCHINQFFSLSSCFYCSKNIANNVTDTNFSHTRLMCSLNRRYLNLHSKYAQYLFLDIAATYCECCETS